MVTLSDFAPVMADVESLYPKDATRNKTALVVSPGLTLGIVQLWVKQYKNRLPFNCRVFNTLDKAEEWIGVF